MAANPTTEVLDFSKSATGWNLRIQTTAADKLTFFHAADGRTETHNFRHPDPVGK